MIKSIKIADFRAVPHLETSLFGGQLQQGIKLSSKKPNVIVGPNGSGKSAFMEALTLMTFTHDFEESALTGFYVHEDRLWKDIPSWSRDHVFLEGMEVKGDFGPGLFFRPGHIPGNEKSVAASMMCGFFNEARDYGKLVENKSSGEGGRARLEKIKQLLAEPGVVEVQFKDWNYGKEPVDLKSSSYTSHNHWRAEHLKDRARKMTGSPVALMDEPEQSLDAREEMLLWKLIEAADTSKVQVIVVTHSLYPIIHSENFNLIETQKGYIQELKGFLDQ